MNFKLVQIGEKEYKFRITNKSQIEIERKVGPLLSAVSRANEGEVMAAIIWGALFPLNHEVTFDKANDIVDMMVDEGIIDTAEKRVEFVMELLEGAGFFSQEDIKEMKKVTEKRKIEAIEQIKA